MSETLTASVVGLVSATGSFARASIEALLGLGTVLGLPSALTTCEKNDEY